MKSGQTHDLLIVFTRYPEPGTTKTRLAKALGHQGAADMQRKLTEQTMVQVRQLQKTSPAAVIVFYEGGSLKQVQEWLGPDLHYRNQDSGDLGQRLAQAFAAAFRQAYRRVVIIGSDCPGLQAGHMAQAFAALHRKDLVLGPATDGGYYLIGLQRHEKSLFDNIPWGSGGVLAETLKIAKQKGLSMDFLEALSDIDRPEDLKHVKLPPVPLHKPRSTCREYTSEGFKGRCSCSIIIPTHNEAENIAKLLPELLATPETEVIVVDGNSSDATVETAKTLGAKVLTAPPGKASQMNAGAEAARGEILLFLHGDTRLAPGFSDQVQETINRSGIAAGAFRLVIDGSGFGLRLVEWLANFRSKVLQMPYGDQGIFVRAEIFSAVGGFPDLPIMEDFELVRRLKRKGRIIILPLAAITSSRRWKKLGVLRTTAVNQAVIIGYLFGIDPHKLAAWYRKN